jgi:hypothetical protein
MAEDQEYADRRRHSRKKFHGQRGGVTFTARLGTEICEIQNVHDVSISGIRLRLARRVDLGSNLELIAQEADFTVNVDGFARWCQEVDDGFELGIEFASADLDSNILFFMSLRKYLDDFDDVPLKDV